MLKPNTDTTKHTKHTAWLAESYIEDQITELRAAWKALTVDERAARFDTVLDGPDLVDVFGVRA